jgi:5-methylthioadenosine/S-adenosylhomocysteine deaminase
VSESEHDGIEHSDAIDLVIAGGDVVTMNRQREVLEGGAVAIAGDQIAAVGATSALRRRWPEAPVLDATDCVVTPGMVNAHQHLTSDPLARSRIPDLLESGRSIFEWSVPLHAAATPDDESIAATIAAAHSALCGVTTVVEAGTVASPDRVAGAMKLVGVRGTVGTWGWDTFDGPFSAPADQVIERQRDVLEGHPRGGLVEGWVTLVGHDLVSDELVVAAADLARSAGVGMTLHISPTSADADAYLVRTGRRPLVHFDRLGVLGPHLLLAHAVWLDGDEIEAILSTRTAVAYCPWAYLRLGQGVTRAGRHAEIVERGGRVALGCDSMNAGDLPDVLSNAALAAGIARDGRVDPTRWGAHRAFELATISGAEAIGMAGRIGSIEPGKLADIVVHDASSITWTPRGDVAMQLVWGSDGRSVRDVFVNGRQIVSGGRCCTIDVAAVRKEAEVAAAALFDRAGIVPPQMWPVRSAR